MADIILPDISKQVASEAKLICSIITEILPKQAINR